MPTFSRGLEYVNRITGIVSFPLRDDNICSTFAGVVPAASARDAAA